MAAVSRLRAPLASSHRLCCLRTCYRARASPQLVSRPSEIGRGRKAFSTSIALQEKKYTTEHEWIELSKDGKTGTIGVSVYAAKNLGDVVYVELPGVGLEVAAGDSMGAVESVKSASDILTPVSGKVIEANDVLQEKPAIINKSPEDEGWIARIEVKDAGELDTLMDVDAYAKFTAE